MANWKTSNDYIILFKKSDFPLLNDGLNYETDTDKWEYDEKRRLLYAPDDIAKSVAYRTYMFQVYAAKDEFDKFGLVEPYDCDFQMRGMKDVRMYHRRTLVDSINEGSLSFDLNDYYLYYGVEYL